MINILFIHQSAELYGSDKTLLYLLQHLDRAKFNPIVVLPSDGLLKSALEKHSITVVIAPVIKLYRNLFKPKNLFLFVNDSIKSYKTLKKLHQKYHFEIIYSNTLAVLSGAIFSKTNKIKHLWHVHEIIVHPKIVAAIYPQLLFLFADAIVCNSKATKINLLKRIPKLEKKTSVIYNGIEAITNLSNNHTTKEKFGYGTQDILITLVGRINRLKGHKWLINTYLKYLPQQSNLKLLFVGSPVVGQEHYLDEIVSIIKENEIDDMIKIIPFTTNLLEIWSITDIAIMPSTEAESFGMVAIEAMFAHKPVIGSNHGGLKEIIKDNETGFLVEPNDSNALAQALTKLIENPDLRKTFGKNGYQRALKEFSIDTYVNKFEKIFDELI